MPATSHFDPATQAYVYKRRVAYHETDALGVVHHSNYIRFFEEARVDWLRSLGLIEIHHPYGPLTFAVTNVSAKYSRPLRFDDPMAIQVEARLEGLRITIRYAIWQESTKTLCCTGDTELVPLTSDMRPARLPENVRDTFSRVPWSGAWPPKSLT